MARRSLMIRPRSNRHVTATLSSGSDCLSTAQPPGQLAPSTTFEIPPDRGARLDGHAGGGDAEPPQNVAGGRFRRELERLADRCHDHWAGGRPAGLRVSSLARPRAPWPARLATAAAMSAWSLTCSGASPTVIRAVLGDAMGPSTITNA